MRIQQETPHPTKHFYCQKLSEGIWRNSFAITATTELEAELLSSSSQSDPGRCSFSLEAKNIWKAVETAGRHVTLPIYTSNRATAAASFKHSGATPTSTTHVLFFAGLHSKSVPGLLRDGGAVPGRAVTHFPGRWGRQAGSRAPRPAQRHPRSHWLLC